MTDVSILIHTRNSAATLERTLASVCWSDDVVVVDMESTDDTIAIARQFGARVVAIPLESWSDAIRNRHLHEPRHPWTLALDSDEYLADDAEQLVAALLADHGGSVDAFAIPRINTLADIAMLGGGWGPDHQWRLSSTGSMVYAEEHHQPPRLRDDTGRGYVVEPVDGLCIHHENYSSLRDLVERQTRYAVTDVYDSDSYDPKEYDQRVHAELSRRLDPDTDGDYSRAAAVLAAWDAVVRRVLHWESLDPRPPFDEALPMPVVLGESARRMLPASVPGLSGDERPLLNPPQSDGRTSRTERPTRRHASLVAERVLRRAWAVHRVVRYQQTLRVRDAIRRPLGVDAFEPADTADIQGESALVWSRSVLVSQALRRSIPFHLRGWVEYPLPPLDGLAWGHDGRVQVSIVIPFHEQFELTLRCMEAATVTAVDVALEIILVDDSSAVDRSGVVAGIEGVEYVRLPEQQGFLAAANAGAARARGDVIVLLNNDTEPQPGWLTALLDELERDPEIGIVGPTLLRPDGAIAEAGAVIGATGEPHILGAGLPADSAQFAAPADVGFVSGACLAVRSSLWWQLGGFDERFRPAYFEDVDLCRAAQTRGLRVRHVPAARVVHFGGQSYGSDGAPAKDVAFALAQRTFRHKWKHEFTENAKALRAETKASRGTILIVDVHVPRPDVEGGGVRLYDVILALLDDGWGVTLLPTDLDTSSHGARDLRAIGVRIVDGIESVRAELTTPPRVIMLCRPDPFAGYALTLKAIWPDAVLVYDSVDLHAQRLASRLPLQGLDDTGLVALVGAVEQAAFSASNLTITVTPEEAAIVQSVVPTANVAVVPFMYRVVAEAPGPDERTGILFLGGYRHAPNVDAALRLAKGVLPAIRSELPDATLTIAGSFPPEHIVALGERAGVAVLGYVADLVEIHARAVACVAPIEWGAGINTKLITAMAHGLPIITTSLGATGLGGEAGEHYLVAETDAEFAACYRRLVEDHELWQRLSDNGRLLVRERFNPTTAVQPLLDWLEPYGVTPKSKRHEPATSSKLGE